MMPAADESKSATTFTGEKLDWIDALIFDRRISNRAARFGTYIANRINSETRHWVISDIAASAECGIPRSKIGKARRELVDLGWIRLKGGRKGVAACYELALKRVSRFLDYRTAQREERRENWLRKRQSAPVNVSPHRDKRLEGRVTHAGQDAVTNVEQVPVTPVEQEPVTHAGHIHLLDTPPDTEPDTLSKRLSNEELGLGQKKLVGEFPDLPVFLDRRAGAR